MKMLKESQNKILQNRMLSIVRTNHSKFGIQQKSEFFVHQILRINMGLDFFKRPTKVCVKTPSRRRYKKEEIIVVVT